MKRESSRAIIIENNKLLCIFRRKIDDMGNKQEYYVIPGGGIEKDETPRETAIRELKEELNIDISLIGYLGVVEKEKTIEHYYVAERVNGEAHLGGEELERMSKSNYYEPMYMDISKLANLNFQGNDLVKRALAGDFVDDPNRN